MSETGAEIAALGLGIGLLFSLICYLVTNLSPGGMITPGWLALALVTAPDRMVAIILVTGITVVLTIGLRKVAILYGKRLFASVVMLAIFVQMTLLIIVAATIPSLASTETLGFIIPGLIAYQLVRQPTTATLLAIGTVTSLAYGVIVTGVLLGFVEETQRGFTAGISSGPLGLGGTGVLIVVGVMGAFASGLALSLARIRRRAAPPPLQAPPRQARPATVATVPGSSGAELRVGIAPLTDHAKVRAYLAAFLPPDQAQRSAEELQELPGSRDEVFELAVDLVRRRRAPGELVNAVALVRHGGLDPDRAARLAGADVNALREHLAATEDRPLF